MALLHRSDRPERRPVDRPVPAARPAARVGGRPTAAGHPAALPARPGPDIAGDRDPRVRSRRTQGAVLTVRRPAGTGDGAAPPAGPTGRALPPSVARVAARTRLSAELLAAILEVEDRTRATLDDMERADALAERLLARRRDRMAAATSPAGRLSA
ncbi:hypothetical protein Ga0074812_107271 [Parafrankia irregularis]|uniref:Uncharacterized protein n=1 Tax=Parafrankia irregularis TaxID=795642 RepID=A0A0S4QLJ2_9ACTN|nr:MULTISPECIES: hypothetical protein [Parafrankia]CUU56387.1 hypothetical protein Ga0074812_107271 [Parafrankia irregularis]